MGAPINTDINQTIGKPRCKHQGNAQETLEWNDRFLLGFAPMEETHEEFVGLVGRMQLASDGALPSLLDALAAHVSKHFEMENQ